MFKNNPKQLLSLAPFVLSLVYAQRKTERSHLKCIFYSVVRKSNYQQDRYVPSPTKQCKNPLR